MSDQLKIIKAAPEHVPIVLDFIKKIAEYEKLSHQVTATEEILHKSLFGQGAVASSLIAYYNGEPAGFAVYYFNFSTFLGKPGLYLEDIFVDPEKRGNGIGGALFKEVAALANERGCERMDWSVLDWNTPAMDFYKSLGADSKTEWILHRLEGSALKKFAKKRKS